jgi:hypothetical protein
MKGGVAKLKRYVFVTRTKLDMNDVILVAYSVDVRDCNM